MKVLIIRNAYDYDFGGAERLSVHIAKELNLSNIETVVVSRQPRLIEYARQNQVATIKGLWWKKQRWTGLNLLLFPLYLIWQTFLFFWYIRLIQRTKSTAVHIMSKDDFIAATFAAHILHKPIVWTDCADLKHLFANHQVWYKNPIGKIIYRMSRYVKKVTLVSKSEQLLIEESLGMSVPANFSVIHIAGKDEAVTPIQREPSDENAVIFSSTSRLVKAKGIGELIDAFNQLESETSNYRLWLIGEGPDSEHFKEKAGSNQRIYFLGHQDQPLIFVAASDVYMQPTHHEGFSLSLAEAAMLGKPMIATNVGGNPELVNEGNGILVPVQDIDQLRLAMQKLADDPELRRTMGQHARHDYKTYFDFSEKIKKEFVPLYEENTH